MARERSGHLSKAESSNGATNRDELHGGNMLFDGTFEEENDGFLR